MRLETFLEKFDLLAQTPNAVTKLRDLVLDLAVHGRLVTEGTRESPAGVGEPSSVGTEACGLPALPRGWRWELLGNLAQFINGDRSKNYPSKSLRVGDGVPFINAGHLVGGDVSVTAMEYITPEHFGRLTGGKIQQGDVLYCLRGSLGKCAVVRSLDRGAIASSLLIIRPAREVAARFIYLCLVSPYGARLKAKYDNGSAQPNLSAGNVKKYLIPLPPPNEQRRIVAKVDELMVLCDRLEAQQQERQTRHAALARASLARFAGAPTPANLNLLFHPAFGIEPDDLRHAILGLAVRGGLTSRRPGDGDARELMDVAMEKRRQTIKANGLRKKDLGEAEDRDPVADLPDSWCIERLGNLVDPENTISYGVLVPGEDTPNGIPFVRAQDLCLANHPERPNKSIAPEIEEPYARTRLVGGEILLCVVGSIGKLGVVPESWAGANIARAVARIKPIPEVLRDYLLIVLQEEAVQSYFTSTTRTLAQPTLNVGMIEQTLIPVPPIAEQGRIVAKVRDLMRLVNGLETQLERSRKAGETLMGAVISELTAAT